LSKFKKWTFVVGAILVGLGVFGYCEFFGPPEVVWRGEIRSGNKLVSRIESYRVAHGHLPSIQSELGADATEQDRIYYEKCSETRYVVWFGTELGESMSYDSGSGVWKPINIACR